MTLLGSLESINYIRFGFVLGFAPYFVSCCARCPKTLETLNLIR